MQTKVCWSCKQELDISSFHNNKTKKDGKQEECKVCVNTRRRAYAKRRGSYDKDRQHQRVEKARQFLIVYKNDKKCANCPESHPACLQFHHLDITKKEINISRLVGNGADINKIIKEIDKCIILCGNCHAKLHYNERNNINE